MSGRSKLVRVGAFAFMAVLVAVTASGGAVAADGGRTVHTRGDERMVPNAVIMSNLHFSPGPIRVASGATVNWVHADKTGAPHTVTIVEERPTTVEEVFLCLACEEALAGHFPNGAPVLVLDPGGDGIDDTPGDSWLFFNGQTISVQVTADAGSTIQYLCAIHPWMQGTIQVID